ncbi:hypothetical protein D0A61_16525 [Pantoea agglomerans]|nr:hypothetical protein D0A61_16525 [Pantoea agglomerans]
MVKKKRLPQESFRQLTNSIQVFFPQCIGSTRREHGQKRKASRAMDKNVRSVFEQRNALARLRAHLRDEVRNRAGRAARDWLKRLSDLTVFPSQARSHS